MASEKKLRELEDKYEGYTVYDNRGEKIGKVDDLFIDEADREEYIGVKMGFFGRKSTLIPMDIVRVNEPDKALEVAESKARVKDAPSFDDDEDITPDYEERILSHFGLQSHDPSIGRGSYSGAREEEHEPEDPDRESHGESSGTDTGYDERRSTGDTGKFERGSSTEGPSRTRETEEKEVFEEGGRTKVRRRIIREEIIEEDA